MAKDVQPVIVSGPDYGYNIGHLNNFKTSLKTIKGIIPISVVGDSISEGANGTDFLVDGFIGIIKDVLQSKYGNAGPGLVSAWKRQTTTPTYVWAKTGTWADNDFSQEGSPAATATLTFSGVGVEIVYLKGSAAGLFTTNVDGAGAVSHNAYNATTFVDKIVINGLTDGSHTLVLAVTDATKKLFLVGAVPVTSVNRGVRIDNFAWYGRKSDRLLAVNLFRQATITYSPKLYIIALTANDYEFQTGLATYKSRFNTSIAVAKEVGSAVLLVANGLRQIAKQVDQKWYTKALYEIAKENNVALIDINTKWGTYDQALANNFFETAEPTHPNNAGHRDMANTILDYILD